MWQKNPVGADEVRKEYAGRHGVALHNYKKDSTGKEKIVTPDGEVVTGRILVGEHGDGAGYISHFASCKKYRR